MANIQAVYAKLSSEDYLCNRTKPIAQLICSACLDPYEAICAYVAGVAGDIGYSCCQVCHSMEEPFEEAL